ncbi:hypothetical protein M9458_045556, partial [Cirrhinus mrigala]
WCREGRSRLVGSVTMSIDMRAEAGKGGAKQSCCPSRCWFIWRKKKKQRSVGLNVSLNCGLRADSVDGYGNNSD